MALPATPWPQISAEAACKEVGCDPMVGLSSQEAARRLAEYGPNALPEDKSSPFWRLVLGQFASPLIYILFAVAVLSFALGKHQDALVILLVVFVNAIIGAFQEGRAERSMASLRKLSVLQVRVLRDGREALIAARELVPGDVMLLAAGDAVGADARLLHTVSMEAGEAALTGESLPVSKDSQQLPADTLIADWRNMVFSGTHITTGRGKAVVVATGLSTEVGKIARMTAGAVEPKTPLAIRMDVFGRQLVAASFILVMTVIAAGVLRGMDLADVIMVAISQMVSLVPEGLPVALTIALAVGMQRMAEKGAIVRRLAAVETLGSTNVICTDKTGTLTKNEMTVTAMSLPDGREIAVSGIGYEPEGRFSCNGSDLEPANEAALRLILEGCVLCNDSQLIAPTDQETRWRALGDPTESALLTVALKGSIEPTKLRREWPRRAEIPFDSAIKLMATQHGHPGQPNRCFIKGAPEILLPLCSQARHKNEVLPLDEQGRRAILDTAEQKAIQGLRLLAFAMVEGAELDERAGFDQFNGFAVFLGLIGQVDPPREEARAAVEECRAAGIRPVMVTGDHKATGISVARALGIARDGDLAVDGRELEAMPEQDLVTQLDRIAVFARVHPAQKLRIVEAFQSQGNVVAMTGDGVNDAPALARADVGVAMGITGTEVAKGAAKIVITDDNFATIVSAVEQGRLVYGNIQKLLLFLFATSLDEVLILLGALLLGYPLPLAAVQILWINLVTEGTLTINLVMEGPEGDEMLRKPLRANEPLITREMLRRMAVMAPTSVTATLSYYIWRHSTGAPFAVVQTETFTLLAVCQWFNVLNCESATRSVFRLGLLKNPWLLGGLLLANLLQLAVVYTVPLNELFHTVPIALSHFFIVGAVASSTLWTEEARKYFARRRLAKRNP
ncbi:MAG: HAD-IC family P-type ATPase [Armatimonadetes bacterium]|nr:HAD-IC family P-type ATPase [Armatimonadota bacterium]